MIIPNNKDDVGDNNNDSLRTTNILHFWDLFLSMELVDERHSDKQLRENEHNAWEATKAANDIQSWMTKTFEMHICMRIPTHFHVCIYMLHQFMRTPVSYLPFCSLIRQLKCTVSMY